MANNESKKLAVDIIARVDKLEKGMARASSTSRSHFKRIEADAKTSATRVNTALGTIGKSAASGLATGFAVLGVGGLAAGAGIAALVDSARTAAAELAKIGDVAGRIGVTAEALQALQFASEQNAGSAEAVNSGLTKFAAGMADASAKGGELFKVLEANNVAFQDASGKLLPVQTVLAKYADLIQNAKTPAEQLELAIRAFGRAAGPELVGLLSQGSGGLREMMAQAKDAGAVLDNDIIAKAQEIDDKFAQIARTVGTQVKGAIVSLFPLLEQFAAHVQRGANMLKLIGPNANRIDDAFNVNAVAKPGSLGGQESALRAAATPEPAPLRLNVRPTILPAAGDGGGASKAQAAAERLANSYKQMIATANGRIESLKTEQQALGMTTAEAEKLRFETDLLNEATRDGATLTDAQRAQIKQLASTYGVLAGEVERAKKAQADAAETMQNLEDIASGGVKGLVSDLVEGTDAATALQNALKRVGDQLLDMALSSALKGMFTAGGGGGGLGGLIGSLFSPGKASGGPVKAGQPYTVGESGRETFVPTQPGRIIPHGRGGGNVQVVVNNNAGAQVSARQTNGPQGPAIHVQIDEAVANALSNGAKTASVLKAWGGNKMR